MKVCNRNCKKCSRLNVKVDDKGYPWGYECLKYGDSVFENKFLDTKEFRIAMLGKNGGTTNV